jgi:hypothetical protein
MLEGPTSYLGAAKGWAAPRGGVATSWFFFVSTLDSVFGSEK